MVSARGRLIFKFLAKSRSLQIVLTLWQKSRGIRELREAVGGSATTIQARVKETEKLGLLKTQRRVSTFHGMNGVKLVWLSRNGQRVAKHILAIDQGSVSGG